MEKQDWRSYFDSDISSNRGNELDVLFNKGGGEEFLTSMRYYELLKETTQSFRQCIALEMVDHTIRFFKNKEIATFIEILQALNKYVIEEYEREGAKSQARNGWILIGKQLSSAVRELQNLHEDIDLAVREELADSYEKSLTKTSAYIRQALLVHIVSSWAMGMEEQQGDLSDILQALSMYARRAAENQPQESQHIWQVVAAIFDSAAREAQHGQVP